MIAAPAAAETEIAIAERAGERDLSDIRQHAGVIERRRRGFQRGQSRATLAGLKLEPFRLVAFPPCASGLRKWSGSRHRECRRTAPAGATPRAAPCRVARHDLAAAGALIEIVEDHAQIVDTRCRPRRSAPESCRADFACAALSLIGGVGPLDVRSRCRGRAATSAIRTLRPNGEDGEERKIIIAAPYRWFRIAAGTLQEQRLHEQSHPQRSHAQAMPRRPAIPPSARRARAATSS